jgi:inorganic pyrophosphatase
MHVRRTDAGFWNALDRLVAEHELVIDRPIGSHHPRFPEVIYPLDCGYLKGTSSMGGSGMDVWMGSRKNGGVDAAVCTLDPGRRDSEVKILLGCTGAGLKSPAPCLLRSSAL